MQKLIFLFPFLVPFNVLSQIDSIALNNKLSESVIEYFLENEESETFDYNTLTTHLESYLEKPLNLNKSTETELNDLGLLTDAQILNFINYRKLTGNLISIYELQAIPGFDLNTIQNLLPFVHCKKTEDLQVSLSNLFKGGNNQLFLRWSRILQTAKGYRNDGGNSSFAGDPNRFYLRYRHSNGTKLSYGFTAEKDPGEDFFRGSNKSGFDFYSAHLFLKDLTENIKALAVGDYNINFGQGLILRTGFSPGKSALTMNIKRSNRPVRSFSSANEIDFMRGLAIQYRLSKNWELVAFGSYRNLDANILIEDDSETELVNIEFTSFQTSGLHRTVSEIADEKSLGQWSFGGSLKKDYNFGHIAFNSIFFKLNKTLNRTTQLYNQFYYAGDQLLNLSIDYSFLIRNINFFGETAYSDNTSIATINGMLVSLDRKMSLSLLFRHFPRNFHTLKAQPFAEKRGARNETGLYIGTEILPNNNWRVNAYFDLWKHPWLNFSVDYPSYGYEWLARITFRKRKLFETYLQVRNEIKGKNLADNDSKIDLPELRERFQTRLHFSYILSNSIELRSRIDAGFFKEGENQTQKGFSMYQDLIFRPKGIPFSIKTRFAIFDTESYDVRYYNYENDVLYAFSIPAYYHEGTRYYVNLRYTGIRDLLFEIRYAQTYWNNQESFGTGNDEISGKRRSEIKMQLRYSF